LIDCYHRWFLDSGNLAHGRKFFCD
jgi:hypothetical protein